MMYRRDKHRVIVCTRDCAMHVDICVAHCPSEEWAEKIKQALDLLARHNKQGRQQRLRKKA